MEIGVETSDNFNRTEKHQRFVHSEVFTNICEVLILDDFHPFKHTAVYAAGPLIASLVNFFERQELIIFRADVYGGFLYKIMHWHNITSNNIRTLSCIPSTQLVTVSANPQFVSVALCGVGQTDFADIFLLFSGNSEGQIFICEKSFPVTSNLSAGGSGFSNGNELLNNGDTIKFILLATFDEFIGKRTHFPDHTHQEQTETCHCLTCIVIEPLKPINDDRGDEKLKASILLCTCDKHRGLMCFFIEFFFEAKIEIDQLIDLTLIKFRVISQATIQVKLKLGKIIHLKEGYCDRTSTGSRRHEVQLLVSGSLKCGILIISLNDFGDSLMSQLNMQLHIIGTQKSQTRSLNDVDIITPDINKHQSHMNMLINEDEDDGLKHKSQLFVSTRPKGRLWIAGVSGCVESTLKLQSPYTSQSTESWNLGYIGFLGHRELISWHTSHHQSPYTDENNDLSIYFISVHDVSVINLFSISSNSNQCKILKGYWDRNLKQLSLIIEERSESSDNNSNCKVTLKLCHITFSVSLVPILLNHLNYFWLKFRFNNKQYDHQSIVPCSQALEDLKRVMLNFIQGCCKSYQQTFSENQIVDHLDTIQIDMTNPDPLYQDKLKQIMHSIHIVGNWFALLTDTDLICFGTFYDIAKRFKQWLLHHQLLYRQTTLSPIYQFPTAKMADSASVLNKSNFLEHQLETISNTVQQSLCMNSIQSSILKTRPVSKKDDAFTELIVPQSELPQHICLHNSLCQLCVPFSNQPSKILTSLCCTNKLSLMCMTPDSKQCVTHDTVPQYPTHLPLYHFFHIHPIVTQAHSQLMNQTNMYHPTSNSNWDKHVYEALLIYSGLGITLPKPFFESDPCLNSSHLWKRWGYINDQDVSYSQLKDQTLGIIQYHLEDKHLLQPVSLSNEHLNSDVCCCYFKYIQKLNALPIHPPLIKPYEPSQETIPSTSKHLFFNYPYKYHIHHLYVWNQLIQSDLKIYKTTSLKKLCVPLFPLRNIIEYIQPYCLKRRHSSPESLSDDTEMPKTTSSITIKRALSDIQHRSSLWNTLPIPFNYTQCLLNNWPDRVAIQLIRTFNVIKRACIQFCIRLNWAQGILWLAVIESKSKWTTPSRLWLIHMMLKQFLLRFVSSQWPCQFKQFQYYFTLMNITKPRTFLKLHPTTDSNISSPTYRFQRPPIESQWLLPQASSVVLHRALQFESTLSTTQSSMFTEQSHYIFKHLRCSSKRFATRYGLKRPLFIIHQKRDYISRQQVLYYWKHRRKSHYLQQQLDIWDSYKQTPQDKWSLFPYYPELIARFLFKYNLLHFDSFIEHASLSMKGEQILRRIFTLTHDHLEQCINLHQMLHLQKQKNVSKLITDSFIFFPVLYNQIINVSRMIRQFIRLLCVLSLQMELYPPLRLHIHPLYIQSYQAALRYHLTESGIKWTVFDLRLHPTTVDFIIVRSSIKIYLKYNFTTQKKGIIDTTTVSHGSQHVSTYSLFLN